MRNRRIGNFSSFSIEIYCNQYMISLDSIMQNCVIYISQNFYNVEYCSYEEFKDYMICIQKGKTEKEMRNLYQNLMDVAYRCAHVGGLGEMKKHLVESTQLSSSVRFFFYCLLEVSLMQTQLVDAHYLIESRKKKKLFSKFHT